MAEGFGVSVRIIPDWQLHNLVYSKGISTIKFEDFLGIHTLALYNTPTDSVSIMIKTFVDYVLASFVLFFSFPLFLFVAISIKISSPGPVFFEQERSGKNGRRFMVKKFRTMVASAEKQREKLEALNESDGPVFKIKDDPRIIPVIGVLLRRTSLDELPQLINVIKGEMSLVGPRPPIPSEVDEYEIWQRRRLSMKPGLTCLWQVTPKRNEVSFKEWMKMDLNYIDTWSLWLDFKILFKTVIVILFGFGR